jgi:hypothetical protein
VKKLTAGLVDGCPIFERRSEILPSRTAVFVAGDDAPCLAAEKARFSGGAIETENLRTRFIAQDSPGERQRRSEVDVQPRSARVTRRARFFGLIQALESGELSSQWNHELAAN